MRTEHFPEIIKDKNPHVDSLWNTYSTKHIRISKKKSTYRQAVESWAYQEQKATKEKATTSKRTVTRLRAAHSLPTTEARNQRSSTFKVLGTRQPFYLR